jgi:hypothetical protein
MSIDRYTATRAVLLPKNGLTTTDKLVMLCLIEYGDNKTGSGIHPNREKVAAQCDVNRSTVDRAIAKLRKKFWLIQVQKYKKGVQPAMYRWCVPHGIRARMKDTLLQEQSTQLYTATDADTTTNTIDNIYTQESTQTIVGNMVGDSSVLNGKSASKVHSTHTPTPTGNTTRAGTMKGHAM